MRKPVIAFTVAVLLFVTVMPASASHGLPHNNEAAFLAANPELAIARRYTLADESARAGAEAALLDAPFRFALRRHR